METRKASLRDLEIREDHLPPLTPSNSPRPPLTPFNSPRPVVPDETPNWVVNTPRADAIGTPEPLLKIPTPELPLRILGGVCKGCRNLEKRVRVLEEKVK